MRRFKQMFVLLLFVNCAYSQITVDGLKNAASQISINNDENDFLPLKDLTKWRTAVIHSGDSDASVFDSIANKYLETDAFQLPALITDSLLFALHDKLKFYNLVIVRAGASGLSPAVNLFFNRLSADTSRKLININGNFPASAYLKSSTSSASSASIEAQSLFGGIAVSMTNPGRKGKRSKGFVSPKIRLGYGLPGAVNVSDEIILRSDSLMQAAIAQHITPGAVVLMIRNGEVILDRAYGKHTYDETASTKTTDIFDMASVTKVTATTPVIMKLYEQGRLALDSPVSKYVEILRTVPGKQDQTIREALLHEAGYFPYIKFYEKLTPLDLSYHQSDSFPLAIAKGFYLRKNYFEDVMWPTTLQSPVPSRGKFVYSDISMYMMKAVAENMMHTPLDAFVQEEFYKPLGMRSSGFKPLERFPESRIVPTTENDNWLRNMRVTGYVNDPGAAMSGGVQGHAGLFATSNDLGIYYQMLLNGGSYGGKKYFEKSTVELFTSRQSKVSTRAYGFAKAPEDVMDKPGQPSASAYGHSGYTGTYVWVDPKYQIVYVCLTNRVYPDDGKTYGPAKFNLRALLLEAFYKACY